MFTRLRLAVWSALLLLLTPVAVAQEEMAATGDYLQSSQAFKDYMLQCAGCHRYDGRGLSHRGIPDFNQSIGLFTRLPAGRQYMIRVPGAAQSQLDNAELARVLNWIVAKYSPEDIAPDYRPFTSAEVGASRRQRFDDVLPARLALTRQLQAMGLEPAPYTYGSTDR
ncbi:MAG TPA: cytochrome C [Alcaligenes sp.]|nr:cytochrome C [Alcaligenes sp.]HRL28221.1 cytochrome C [Alcaligenes sp.]